MVGYPSDRLASCFS